MDSPQSWNRYSYVGNNPVRFADPTGHAGCDPEDQECRDQLNEKADARNATYLANQLKKKYRVNIRGNWSYAELKILSAAMQNVSNFVGGDANLNAAILAAAKKNNAQATSINIDRISQSRWNLGTTSTAGPSVAAWCGQDTSFTCSNNAMVIADDALSLCYQQGTCGASAYPRSPKFTNDQLLQFTVAHEFGHVLSQANPNALNNYQGGGDEQMANELADHIVSGGTISTPFTRSAPQYWNPNWSSPRPPSPNLPNVPWQ